VDFSADSMGGAPRGAVAIGLGIKLRLRRPPHKGGKVRAFPEVGPFGLAHGAQ